MKKLIQKFIRKFGYSITRMPVGSHLRGVGALDIEMPVGYEGVDIIVDVGVAGGTPWLYEAFPTQMLYLIDPLPLHLELRKLLSGRRWRLFEVAAGATRKIIEINRDLTNSAASSILDRTSLTKRPEQRLEKIEKPQMTLDELMLPLLGDGERVGLKIDSEGYEAEIILGATELLRRTDFVICEVSIEQRFENGYDMTKLVEMMSARGFRIRSFLRCSRRSKGVIKYADVLFVPSGRS